MFHLCSTNRNEKNTIIIVMPICPKLMPIVHDKLLTEYNRNFFIGGQKWRVRPARTVARGMGKP